MSKSVLISVNPEWCELIASGEKTVEVRKTRPKLETPFKVYIYCTQDKNFNFCTDNGEQYTHIGNGKVIGEFVCDSIEIIKKTDYHPNYYFTRLGTCLEPSEMWEYGKGKPLYAWHISNLVIYDKPKELSEFKQCHKCEYYADCYEHEYSCDGVYNLTRPPQSWCYVEVT